MQDLLGHKAVSTTMFYTHVLNRGPLGVRSPADLVQRFEQVVLGPENHCYQLGALVAHPVLSVRSAESPQAPGGGSRTAPQLRPWFSEPVNKELGGQTASRQNSRQGHGKLLKAWQVRRDAN